jgi:glyoxylase-like metal-dependent hydrolase (beta-lactamase superfamily II)/rhodanese-related sulfurtransferase
MRIFVYSTQKTKNMKIEQIYTGCLAQGAYYITSNGEAAIIDPLRETKPYTDRLENDNVKLKYIFETHFHADFVSGHLDLSQQTGASIVYGPNASPDFDFISAKDSQEFNIGNLKIKVLHTPGHTMESTTFLLIDKNGKDHAIFSGDTLFIGDVGRPDLAQKAASVTQDELAGILFHSLRTKIMTLADDVLVYPAHGAGSACGKNMSTETVSTIGKQKEQNYALRLDMTEAEFITEVTDGLLPPPAYFGMNVTMNKSGIDSFDTVLNNGMRPIEASEFAIVAEEMGALILDTRTNAVFAKGYIPQSINIGITGDFAPWVGALIADVNQPIILVTETGKEVETVTRLSRVGFDHLIGYLKGGFEAWKNARFGFDTVNRITPQQFAEEVKIGQSTVIDVRRASEYKAEHVDEAYSKPLSLINEWVKDINPEKHFYMHCAGGYRSMIAASILQARGFRNFTEIGGGFNEIAKTTVPKTDFVCQSKVLKV